MSDAHQAAVEAEARGNETVTIRHTDSGREMVTCRSAVPRYQAQGWALAENEPAAPAPFGNAGKKEDE